MFRRKIKMKMVELLPWKLYPFTSKFKYIYMRRFREYTSNRHNISVALDPHGMLK